MNSKELTKIVDKEIGKFIDLSGVDATYDCEIEEVEGVTNINIGFEGENLGYMIGSHGRHLDSLQYILQLLIRRAINDEEFSFRLTLDVADYRKERNETIERMALTKADDARMLGDSIDMVPMKPYDRRVVHMVLEKFEDITTESHGEGRDRYVRIVPAADIDVDIMKDVNGEESEDSEE
ncbi:KH domain-containing protein [bacterium]|nr:KH domain-containing protein [bacterium]